jgi:hypothetical protein
MMIMIRKPITHAITIAHLFLHLVQKLYGLSPERSATGGVVSVPVPASFPITITQAGAYQFSNLLE